MRIRLDNKHGLISNLETPKAYAIQHGRGRVVFVPKSKSMVIPVESSRYLFIDVFKYHYSDIIIADSFADGKDDLIELLTEIYHYNKMYKENTTDILYKNGK